jgi:hypothetical protein
VADETPTGELEFSGPKLTSVDFSGAKGPIIPRPANNRVTLPAGVVHLFSARFNISGESGVNWDYEIVDNAKQQIEVNAGNTTTLKVGAPLKMDIVASPRGSSCGFALNLLDTSGYRVQGIFDSNNQRPKEPQLVVSNSEGKVLKTIPFAYG